MRFIQRSIHQTGVAVIEMADGSEKEIPTFTVDPSYEAQGLLKYLGEGCEVKHVFCTNNLMSYKIGDEIQKFIYYNNFLPEDLMEDLAFGFPFIYGREDESTIKCYG